MASCFFFHDWGPYEPPKRVVQGRDDPDKPTVAQRRECKRCAAVDYRRVMIHS